MVVDHTNDKSLKQGRQCDEESAPSRTLRFWAKMLPLANAQSSLHQDAKPKGSRNEWLQESSNGLHYGYVSVREYVRVELLIVRKDSRVNHAIFDDLERHQSQIEAAFGRPLKWTRHAGKTRCRIFVDVKSGKFSDETTWPVMHAEIVETMMRFEAALHRYVEGYRKGGVPNGC